MNRAFESHELWRLVRALVCGLYGVSGRGGFFRDASLRDRVRCSAVSLMSAVAELVEGGDAAGGGALIDLRRRCVRLRSELVVAGDQGYLADVELRALVKQVEDFERALRRASVDGERVAAHGASPANARASS